MKVQRLQVAIGRRRLGEPVLNDVLYCAENPAVTTRYLLSCPAGAEEQRSSGLWISTPAGSTAALRSAGGDPMPLDADRFAFRVREPYAPPGSSVRIPGGVLEHQQSLVIECRLPQAGLYLDGSHRTYRVQYGERTTVRLHPNPLLLVRPIERSSALARGL
jgi:NAD+ kinase